MTEAVPRTRLRACAQAFVAVFYYFLARSVAHHGALGLASENWSPLVEQAMLVFLLIFGYAAMGFWFQRQMHPISRQGLPRRAGFGGEFALGLAAGWAIAVVCVLPMALAGGIAVLFSGRLPEWGWFAADALFFLLATLAEEVAFRGYGFQRFVEAAGPLGGALGFSAYYALVQQLLPGSSRASFAVSLVLGLLLSAAYLRSRALWVSWGVNFGWKASRALLFGLAVSGVGSHSSLVEGDPMGPFWLTGGGFGLDGTWIAFFVILAAIPVIFRLTRDLNYRYNAPVLEPGGIPVDLEAAARAQHEAAMGPVSPPLVRTIEPARGSAANGPVSGPVNGPVSGPVSRPVSEPANGPASVPGAAPGSSASGETPVDPPTTS